MTDVDMDIAALRESVRDVLARELDSQRLHRLTDERALIDQALWNTAKDLGWPALTIPEDHGGLGLGPAESAVLFEELGRALAPLPALGGALVAKALALGANSDQQARWLSAIAAGEVLCGVSLGASDSPAPRLRREGDENVLTGPVRDILQGGEADLLIILAQDADGAPALVLVEPKADNVALTVERTVDRTRHLASAAFKGLRLPADRVLTVAPETLLLEAALAIASDSIGGAQAVFEKTLDYLRTREQFGKPIGSFQALKHRCADHKVALAASGSVVAEAVRLQAEGAANAPLMARLAKAYACEVYARVAEDAVQLHGGIGFTWEHDCHLFLKRAKLNQALLGGTAAQLDAAADLLLAS